MQTSNVEKMQQKIKEFRQEPIVVLPDYGDQLNIVGSHTFHKIKSSTTHGAFSGGKGAREKDARAQAYRSLATR